MNTTVPEPKEAFRNRLGYKKFQGESLTVLLLKSGKAREDQCRVGLEAAGHRVAVLSVVGNSEAVVGKVIEAIGRYKPDFVLSINNIGFDPEGELSSFCEAAHIPVAVWYVKSPAYVLQGATSTVLDWTTAFLWERSFASQLSQHGYNHVSHLSLATNFSLSSVGSTAPIEGITLVGRSFEGDLETLLAKIPQSEHSLIVRLSGDVLHDKDLLLAPTQPPPWMPSGCFVHLLDMMKAASSLATIQGRSRYLEPLWKRGLKVFGDGGWLDQVPQECFGGSSPQGSHLGALYRHSTINVCLTPADRYSAVSQRVFDIYGCGGFLLTDNHSEFLDLFDFKEESVLFSEPEQLEERLSHFETRPELRKSIAKCAYESIQSNHTYYHRMLQLAEVMRDRYS